MKTTVIHHSADFDGIFCREIARKFLPDAELIGWDFKDEPLPVPSGKIYVMDLPVDRVFGCNYGKLGITDAHFTTDAFDRIIWIDHHKSSIESHPTSIPGYRIDGVAACRLAWQWFSADRADERGPVFGPLPTKEDFIARAVKEPYAVRLAGEYDIWDKRDPNAELFQHGLRSRDLDRRTWEQLLNSAVPPVLEGTGMEATESELVSRTLLDSGSVLQYARTRENASIIQELGFTFQWEGLTFLACNAARYNSLLFTAGLKPEHDACFGFKFTGHVAGGKPFEEWSISLYHAPGKEHIDLSLIAGKYGGGGHRGACGFSTATLPFVVQASACPHAPPLKTA